MQKKLIHHILDIALKILNFVFSLLIIGLTAIAIFKPSWIAIFIKWVEAQIVFLGNWNYLIAFASSIVESFPVIGVLVPGQNIMLLVGGFFGRQGSVQFAYMICLAIV